MMRAASLWNYRWIPLAESPTRYAFRGLVQRISLLPFKLEHKAPQPAPFGWCCVRDEDRCSVMLMPIWMKPIVLWPRYRWVLHERLVRLGLWDLPKDGDYYRNGRWKWRWWHGEDRALAPMVAAFDSFKFHQYQRRNWWMRLGWWIEKRSAHVAMPMWTP